MREGTRYTKLPISLRETPLHQAQWKGKDREGEEPLHEEMGVTTITSVWEGRKGSAVKKGDSIASG